MLAAFPTFDEMLTKLQLLEEKIKYSERQLTAAMAEGKTEHEIKRLKLRLCSLKKERSLYHGPMQKLRPFVGYQSYLYNKIESLSAYNSSRY
jgi:hypothetical protein